jgi:DNA-binding NarL/FixJ family response regulator
MTRIFIIAATPILRSGLRAMLSTTDIEVVGEAPALTLYDGAELRGVQVVVVDERLLEDTLVAIEGDRTLSVVVLSDDERIAAQLREVNLRSWGMVLPDAPPEELQAAVMAAAQGLIVLPARLSERIFTQPIPVKALPTEPLDEPLTSRELEVLDWLGQGLSNKLIARQLQISEHTVKFHISSIYAKLGVSSRTEAVRRGSHLGLITH